MRSSFPVVFAAVLLTAAVAQAARVDMKDPRRALGSDDDVRIDAEVPRDTVSPDSPISVTYQVENLSSGWIAIADKVSDLSYDPESRTITLSLGAEVPANTLPHLTAIAPGEKKTFIGGAVGHIAVPSRGPFTAAPRYVQIKVNVLRDLTAFRVVLEKQAQAAAPPVAMTAAMFDAWLDASDSILLNTIPVRWSPRSHGPSAEDATNARPRGMEQPGDSPY